MLVNIVGLGYIGLPTSLMLAAKGNDVIGTDINEELVLKLNSGLVTFEENGLQNLFKDAIDNGITFSNDYSVDADVYIVTVPTPYDIETKKIDPTFLIDAVKTILGVSNKGAIIVIESTVSPGTINKYIRPLLLDSSKKFELVHAPERILPGAMIDELISNPRTVGADDEEVGNIIVDLYKTFCIADISLTTIEVAEMSKVVENTFRDINIAFANELTKICKKAQLDIYEVIKIANQHPRVNILSPGPGVGGHCISVDPWFLVGDYPEDANLILQARIVNDSMPAYVLGRLREVMGLNQVVDFSRVGIYGITYKENVDDIRESPTMQFYSILNSEEKNMKFYDPMLKRKIIDNQMDSLDLFLENLDVLVVFVAHDEIKNIKFNENLIIFDTKNIIEDRVKETL